MNEPASIGKLIIGIGIAVVIFGLLILLLSKLGLKGHPLPGDILIRRGNTTIYIPIVTGIVISIILTPLMWAFSALRR